MDESTARQLLLKPEEAARQLGVSRSTVFDLIAHRKIESLKIGRSRRILQSEVERFVSELREEQHGSTEDRISQSERTG